MEYEQFHRFLSGLGEVNSGESPRPGHGTLYRIDFGKRVKVHLRQLYPESGKGPIYEATVYRNGVRWTSHELDMKRWTETVLRDKLSALKTFVDSQ